MNVSCPSFGPAAARLGLIVCLAWASVCQATPHNANTDWFQAAKYGVLMHLLPTDGKELALVQAFDVESLAKQLESMGAKYFVITLGQNSGYYIAPNAAYDRRVGLAPGERCSTRDLPLDLYRALQPRGIRLMLYLPCQTPLEARVQRAFGLPQGKGNQTIDPAFAAKWSEVIQEWSDRYGDKVAGWWFDGGYSGFAGCDYDAHVGFTGAIAAQYAAAAKHGNPKAIVAFNPGVIAVRGVEQPVHYVEADDYTAGELNLPLAAIPAGRWLGGSQWHALTFVGSGWAGRDTRYTDAQWSQWVRAVADKGGVVTLDMGPNWDPKAGPIGSFAEAQVRQVQAIKSAVRGNIEPLAQ